MCLFAFSVIAGSVATKQSHLKTKFKLKSLFQLAGKHTLSQIMVIKQMQIKIC